MAAINARTIMVQGTGLYVGKSLIALAICRYYAMRGLKTARHKAGGVDPDPFAASPGKPGKDCDLIVLEGEGSPADIHLPQCDPGNMGAARLAGAPVLLVGDIDRGGVFAQLAGTLDLLAPADAARVAGLIINKYRGEVSRLEPGLRELEAITGKPVLGVLPYLEEASLDFCSISANEITSAILAGWLEANLNMPLINTLL